MSIRLFREGADDNLPKRPYGKLTRRHRYADRLRLSRTTTHPVSEARSRSTNTHGMSTLVKPINSMFGVTTELIRSVM